jgi:hypothetical protein
MSDMRRREFITLLGGGVAVYGSLVCLLSEGHFDNEEEQEWIKSVETFCRAPPV